MALIGVYSQQPDERLDYDIDYTDWLESGDSVLSATVSVFPATGLTVNAIANSPFVKVWAYDGTDKQTFKIEVTMTTTAGRIKQDEIRIICKDI